MGDGNGKHKPDRIFALEVVCKSEEIFIQAAARNESEFIVLKKTPGQETPIIFLTSGGISPMAPIFFFMKELLIMSFMAVIM